MRNLWKSTNDNSRKLFNLIGLMIFGGMFLTSVIDAQYYSEKNQLKEYRLFILGATIIYYSYVNLFNKLRR